MSDVTPVPKPRRPEPPRAALLALALAGAAALCLPACDKPKPQDRRGRPLLGFSMDSLVAERWARDRDVFLSAAGRMGADVILQVAEEDPTVQEAQILYLADQDVDCLVVVANNPITLARPLNVAKKKGIPVLCYDRLVRNAGADLLLSFDYQAVGRLQAQGVYDRMGKGAMLIINGLKSDPNAGMAHAGIMEVLAPAIESGDVSLVDDYWPQTPSSEEAYALVERLVDRGAKIDGIIAYSDMLAESAIRALAVKRLAGKVVVAGADADLAACQRIAEGTQYMTVYKPIEEIASKAAELAIFMAGAERFTVHKAVWDGSNRVPFYVLDPVFVSRENLGHTVIKDGFHLAQDVYRNVPGQGWGQD